MARPIVNTMPNASCSRPVWPSALIRAGPDAPARTARTGGLASGTVENVTYSSNTTYASGGSNVFGTNGEKNEYFPVCADANHAFPLYATYKDPCNGTTHTWTLHLNVLPSSSCSSP